MKASLTVTTKFSENQLLLRTNQICQSFAVIVFKFKDHRLLHKSHKVQTLAFSRKNFFLNGMMRPDRGRRGGAHLTIHGEVKNSSGRKLFSVEVLISSETQDLCPCWLWFPANWTSCTPSCTSTVVFVLTIFRTNNTPSPKTSKLLLFSFYLKNGIYIFKGLPGPKSFVFQPLC